MSTITPHAALIYLMVITSASDARMTDRELATIGRVVRNWEVFRGFDPDQIIRHAQECAAILDEEQTGLDTALALAREALPAHLRETAYLLALEVALADRNVVVEEVRVTERIRHALQIDRLAAAALERGARARHQTV